MWNEMAMSVTVNTGWDHRYPETGKVFDRGVTVAKEYRARRTRDCGRRVGGSPVVAKGAVVATVGTGCRCCHSPLSVELARGSPDRVVLLLLNFSIREKCVPVRGGRR
jgi:hypothetical protein